MKSTLKFISIRTKLILGGLLTVLVPTLLSDTLAVTIASQIVSKLRQETVQSIAEGAALQLSAVLDGEEKFIDAFAARAAVRAIAEDRAARPTRGDTGAAAGFQADLRKRFELLSRTYEALFITDASGEIFAEAAEQDWTFRDWKATERACFTESKQNRHVYSSDFTVSELSGRSVIYICSPIISTQGEFIGIVGSLLKAPTLTDLVTSRRIGKTGYCFLTNNAGRIVAHPIDKRRSTSLAELPGATPLAEALKSAAAGTVTYSMNGLEKFAGLFGTTNHRWTVIVAQETAELNEHVAVLQKSNGLLCVLSVLIIGVLIFVVATALTKSLSHVIAGLKDMAVKGPDALTSRISVTSNDEIGLLASEFNTLLASLQKIAVFKKVLESERTLPDVYQRLGLLFTTDFGIACCSIFLVTPSGKGFVLGFPNKLPASETTSLPSCFIDICDDCDACKAKRTGRLVSSNIFDNVCQFFRDTDTKTHYCFPILVGGQTSAIIQLQFPIPKTADDQAEIARLLYKTEQYLAESLTVIEAKQLLASLRESAVVDALTGCFNRRYLHETAEKLVAGAVRRGQAIGVLMCDIDHFKAINDTYGHASGDIVLRETARSILHNVRESDIVIRFGGEEFLVLLIDIAPEEILKIAEKIRRHVEKTAVHVQAEMLSRTLSIGAAEFPTDTPDFAKSIKYADAALYQAKRDGRNQCTRFQLSSETAE